VHDFDACDERFELEQPWLSPAASQRAIAQLGRGLEGDEGRTSGDDRRVAFGERRAEDEVCTEDGGVDEIGPRGRARVTT
jgi:hypothetical protein